MIDQAAIKAGIYLGVLFGTGVVIDEKTLLPIGTIISICGMIWWLGRKLQKFEDEIKSIRDTLDELPCYYKCNHDKNKKE